MENLDFDQALLPRKVVQTLRGGTPLGTLERRIRWIVNKDGRRTQERVEFYIPDWPNDLCLRSVTLEDQYMPKREDGTMTLPIGHDHKDDGVLTEDGYPWAEYLHEWFLASFLGGKAADMMSRSRLAEALKFMGRKEASDTDGMGDNDANYDGPSKPPPQLVYSEPHDPTYRFRDIYEDMPFDQLPQLHHTITNLPEMLTARNILIPEDDPIFNHPRKAVETYYRVYPPPRYVFDDERVTATITFSTGNGDVVGSGNSGVVFRAKYEHSDDVEEVTQCECDEDLPVELDLDGKPYPFARYTPRFFRAVFAWRKARMLYKMAQLRAHRLELEQQEWEMRKKQLEEEEAGKQVKSEETEKKEAVETASKDGDKKKKNRAEAVLIMKDFVPPSQLSPQQQYILALHIDDDDYGFDWRSKITANTTDKELNDVCFDLFASSPYGEVMVPGWFDDEKMCIIAMDYKQLERCYPKEDWNVIDKMIDQFGTEAILRPPFLDEAPMYRFIRRKKCLKPYSVLAKISFGDEDCLNWVKNEGKLYGLMPEYLSGSYKGYAFMRPFYTPLPYVPAVPKSYGMYVNKEGRPILLMEECGTPIPKGTFAFNLAPRHKVKLLTMLIRIHRFGIIQNSMNLRNILMEPGPLYLPPEERSMEEPSFRIIDFGRGEYTPFGWQKSDYIDEAEDEEERLATEIGFERNIAYPIKRRKRMMPGKGYDPNFRY